MFSTNHRQGRTTGHRRILGPGAGCLNARLPGGASRAAGAAPGAGPSPQTTAIPAFFPSPTMPPITLIVFAGFYPAARHAVRYADTLAQALRGKLVLLHVNQAALFDPYALMSEGYHQEALGREADTAAALCRLAETLPTRPTVEVATDLLPATAQDLAARHAPALFVLSQPNAAHPSAGSPAAGCAELLRAGHHPVLVVPGAAPANQPPARILLAVDREPFALAAAARPLQPLFGLAGTRLFVAHISSGVDDDAGCAAALRAVQGSGLVKENAPAPELRGYEHDDHALGLLAAVHDIGADLVVVLARPRSYLGELFHRSVTARLLATCPVPVLVLPTAPVAAPATPPADGATTAEWAAGILGGLSPAY